MKRFGRSKMNVDQSAAGKAARTVNGICFHSQAEARRYSELSLMVRAGVIRDLELQPEYPIIVNQTTPVLIRSKGFPNGRKVKAIFDFQYRDAKTGALHVEDVKGMDTDYSRLKRALVEAIYGITIEIVK